MKETIFTGWDLMRWIRLGIAGIFLAYYFLYGESTSLFAAVFFGLQAVFNLGCGGACAYPNQPVKQTATSTEEVDFEEIKSTQR